MAFITSLSQFITSGISYNKHEPAPSPYILSSSPPDNTMELYVLEHRLQVCSIPKDVIRDFCHPIINIALLPNSRPNFFSFTETDTDYTLIVTKDDFQGFPDHPRLQTAGSLWRVLTVSVGAMGAGNELVGVSKIAKSVIGPLADNNISVLCLSTYQSDFILVQEPHLDETIRCLGHYFKIFNEDHKRVNDTKILSSSPVIESSKMRPIIHPFHCPKTQFHITGLDASKLPGVVQILLELMFFPSGPDPGDPEAERFFHFSIVCGDISLVMDSDSIQKFPNNVLYTRKNDICWRMITVGETALGFEQPGLVAQMILPIAKMKISSHFISSLKHGHTWVLETDLDRVSEILEKQRLENRKLSRQLHPDHNDLDSIGEHRNTELLTRPRSESEDPDYTCTNGLPIPSSNGLPIPCTKGLPIPTTSLAHAPSTKPEDYYIQFLVSPDSPSEEMRELIDPLEHKRNLEEALTKLQT